MKTFFKLFLFLTIFFSSYVYSCAIENPTAVDNNRFGIHILDENDLEDAARLVNSSGGDWGYITFVIREDERDLNRWQKVFDKARRLHLIPIVRIATRQEGGNWLKPNQDNLMDWVNFFDSLNWVVKNKYVIIGNEPNHAAEWGGEVNPTEYGEYYQNLAKLLKISSPDYFIMPAGFDASAPDNKIHMSEEKYLKTLFLKYPKLYEYIDGWSSHSYPNPNFSGDPSESGKISIKTYEWEMSILKKMGISKNFPVFITETGWAHSTNTEQDYLDPEKLSEYYKKLFETYLSDPKIVTFTPFILNYDSPPFDKFSWKKNDGMFYNFFEETQKVLKIKGNPIQITEAEIIFEIVPEFLKKENKVFAAGIAKNTGQSIWLKGVTVLGYEKDSDKRLEIDPSLFLDIEPGKIGIILYRRL